MGHKSIQPTYEELKQVWRRLSLSSIHCIQPTYEELKHRFESAEKEVNDPYPAYL
mgnify:CR=1 FL=1